MKCKYVLLMLYNNWKNAVFFPPLALICSASYSTGLQGQQIHGCSLCVYSSVNTIWWQINSNTNYLYTLSSDVELVPKLEPRKKWLGLKSEPESMLGIWRTPAINLLIRYRQSPLFLCAMIRKNPKGDHSEHACVSSLWTNRPKPHQHGVPKGPVVSLNFFTCRVAGLLGSTGNLNTSCYTT